jgi:hypothetical protein
METLVEKKIHFSAVFFSGVGGMDWIDMAQDMDRWRAVVSVIMNLRVS